MFRGEHLIDNVTVYKQLVCDHIEGGLGLSHTALLVNNKVG